MRNKYLNMVLIKINKKKRKNVNKELNIINNT